MTAAMTVGSMFSGIGGLDLGLERAGMHVRWQCEMDRVAYGLPGRVDRIRALGNAVVPQMAEVVGHRIMAAAS